MNEFMQDDRVATVVGGALLLFFLYLVVKLGPLRVLAEMAGHAVMNVVGIVVLILVLGFFAGTSIGQSLGGLYTGFAIILGAPVVMIAVGVYQGWRGRKNKPHDDSDVF